MDPARAKSYLMELSRQRQTIRRLNEHLTEIQSRMGASSPRLQEEHVRKSRVYDSLERAAVQAADLKQEIQERTLNYWIRREEIIERICAALGKEREFLGERYHAFPPAARLAEKGADFYAELGAGYRDAYLAATSERIAAEGIEHLFPLPTPKLKKQLLTYIGIGPKVADCISLFGFGRRECFPVDTWIEKLYREDFGGTLKDRNRINAYFCELFGDDAGYMQQYLFYAKRENM